MSTPINTLSNSDLLRKFRWMLAERAQIGFVTDPLLEGGGGELHDLQDELLRRLDERKPSATAQTRCVILQFGVAADVNTGLQYNIADVLQQGMQVIAVVPTSYWSDPTVGLTNLRAAVLICAPRE